MTIFGLCLSVVLGAASLAWGFYAAGWASFSAWILAFGALWLLAIGQNWDWLPPAGLILAVLTAVFGLFLKFHPGWMFAGGLFALFAWDLSDFRARARLVVKDDNFRKAERRHLLRVNLLLLAGLGLASAAMFLVRAKFALEWAALLALTALLGFGQWAAWRRKK